MLKRNLQLRGNNLLFIPLLVMIGFISISFQHKKHNVYTSYKKLIIGRWVYKSKEVGNVMMVFNENGSG